MMNQSDDIEDNHKYSFIMTSDKPQMNIQRQPQVLAAMLERRQLAANCNVYR